MRATTSTPPRQVPSVLVGAGEPQRLEPVAQVVEGQPVRQRHDQRGTVGRLGEDLPVEVGR